MKCHIPQISWHNRDPVLSIDFQTNEDGIRRLATAGTDTHVLIWLLTLADCGNISLEFVADLNRHTKAVNAVRFSPNGEILASADDEATIILWKQQASIMDDLFADHDTANKEHWVPLKTLRGHIDDVCDISWSSDGLQLLSGSVDNTAILWDITKGKSISILSEHKGFVQGVSLDPKGQFLATLSSDRSLRIYNSNSKKIAFNVQKAVLPNANKELAEGQTAKAGRIFYDDTLKSFCRRLCFSPDGELLIVPSGIVEEADGKFSNATYIFTRNSLNKPVLYLPSGNKFTLAVRCCPILFQLRNKDQRSDGTEFQPLFSLPYRIVFAVATQDSIYLYDTQQTMPIARVSNIHYTRLSDLSWSGDGRILMASSTDGYCSFLVFEEDDLGSPYLKTEEKNGETVAVDEIKSRAMNEEHNKEAELTEVTQTLDFNLVLEPSTALDELPMAISSKDTTHLELMKDMQTTPSEEAPQIEKPASVPVPSKTESIPTDPTKKVRRVPLITLKSTKGT